MAILLIIGTFCENYMKKYENTCILTKVFICWSVKRNVQKLLYIDTNNQTLSAIHGMRVLTMIWITVNHTYLFGGLYKIRWIYSMSNTVFTF